jgi:hypothetical protein
MMSTVDGGTPGGIVELGADLTVLRILRPSPDDGFNPHGLAIDHHQNRMISTDFLEAKTVAESLRGTGFGAVTRFVASILPLSDRMKLLSWGWEYPPMPRFRNTIRVWDLDTSALIQTVEVGRGPMEITEIPEDPIGRAVLTNTAEGSLGIVSRDNSGTYAYRKILTFGEGANASGPGGTRVSQDGRTAWVALYGLAEVRRYDISHPDRPSLMGTAKTGLGSHYLRLSADQMRGYVSDYFLQAIEGWVLARPDLKVWRFEADTMDVEELANFGSDTSDPLLRQYAPLQPHGIEMR